MSNRVKKKTGHKSPERAPQKKRNMLPFLAFAAAVICAVVVVLVNGNRSSENSEVITIGAGGSLVIPAADITADASFFPVEVDGTNLEVIAVRDSGGNIRTAFNTCQVCYDSGRGYYIQSGDYLVCQNCGNRFSMDQVQIESGGCNPWPIFDEDKAVTADEISISYDFLVESQGIFANWKGNY